MKTTISPSQKIVQSAHAVIEANFPYQPSLVILGSDNIEETLTLIQSFGIKCFPFYEPYYNNSLTAFTTELIDEEQRYLFKEFKLI